ncbi:hypothetical protein [Aquimarina macrocephali]|uniref:hypothetical protein n=1 Tax=Aquimarina macrocephali TaxID=666563 RepID=UPI003F67C192
MKINWSLTRIIFLLFLASSTLFSQDKGVYLDNVMLSIPGAGESTSGNLSFITPCSTFNVNEGKVWVKIDLGENYEFGYDNFGVPFEIGMDLEIKVLTDNPGTDPAISFKVELNNNKPESVVFLDLNQYIDTNNNSTGLSYLGNKINGVVATVSNLTNTAVTINAGTELNVGLNYEMNYGIDVSANTVSNLTKTAIANSKAIVFNWADSCNAPGYEFQIIRLFNTDPATSSDQRTITTTIDWNKALSLHVDGATTSIDLTMGEGQGYYTWRVRPIGTYYENGIGNNKNWGSWNALDYTACTSCVFTPSTTSNQVFFFTDVDDQQNYQYSRVFTENNKVSEQVTYATSLNQVKQTQRYIPSKDYKVITQTILDNSGRPTINTLPVPIVGEKINAYKEGFVQTSESLYKAKDFDEESNYNAPAMIDATGAFEYYSGANADKRIPNAKGYPFTRVIFSNDGTDRVVEQSGVGKTHMIGNIADGKTRTTRTLYSTPTEDELVKLFGDEAPNHQDVAKIITVDPNSTRSVSYITKEGNTIATGLTFSEDDTVLDSVKDTNPDNIVKGVTDRITNNIKTSTGFLASKRITILEDGTDVNISYTITRPVLDGLCHNLELNLDYNLKIEVFDISTGNVVHSFEQPTLKDLTDTTNDGIDNVTVDFGNVILSTGTYYIQKTLVPSDSIKLDLVNAEDNINKLIKPFFDWIIDFSNEIDCEEEMEYLYNDIFHFGKLVYNKQLAANIVTDATTGRRSATVNFDCVGCSDEKISFSSKDPTDPEADDEFLDYYIGKEEQYKITVYYFDPSGDLKAFDYATDTSIAGRRPVKVGFETPCCQFQVPILFTPPFRTPIPTALEAYRNNKQLDDQVVESISYFGTGATPLTTPNPDNPINPNPNFLLDTENNFTYEKLSDGSVTLKNTDAYPIDFEGYAISMLYECKSAVNIGYTRERAAAEIYAQLVGWQRPGVFNQMVYHMATDKYGDQDCPKVEEDIPNHPVLNGNYKSCDYPKPKVILPESQYSAQELAECWEPIVIELVNKLCVGGYDLDSNEENNVADSYDTRGGDSEGHLKDNINNFIVRWIAKRKLVRRIRRQNISTNGVAQDQAEAELGSVVHKFFECTGYKFGDIINEVPKDRAPKANFAVFQPDFDTLVNSKTNLKYTKYDRKRLTGLIGEWLDLFDPETRELYYNIKDPVYAFKYFEYKEGTFPILEGETCFRDPNICIEEVVNETTGQIEEKEFGCCGEYPDGTPIPCNFCDVGYIKCEQTSKDWNCDQRLTFYNLVKDFKEEVIPDVVPVNCGNYFEATSYVLNPDYEKETGFILTFTSADVLPGTLSGLEFLSADLFAENGGYITNDFADMPPIPEDRWFTNLAGEPQATGVSMIENEISLLAKDCNENCEEKRELFRQNLIRLFEERCYVIGKCKIDPNDNIVPEEDIDVLVEQIVQQCKKQCEVDTYACIDETCRLLGAPTRVDRSDPNAISKYTIDLSFPELGVSGPVVAGLSTREAQKLKYFDPLTGITTQTNESPIVENLPNGLIKYSYNTSAYPFVTIWDIRQSLTYAQSTRQKQAVEWTVKLDIPSKCDDKGNYNPDLTYDTNNLPVEPVYVYNRESKKWELQSFGICTDQADYITRQNPNGPGDTFVDRDKYIKTTKKPFSPSDPDFDPVESPKTGINVVIDPNN